ncbi:hypothetical protein K491DRAFT_605390 [Lophiostoma macrostomum CBS 122681]|uniref:RTA1-domain-containing protein n=1 Tax=Lophiostoma macrostomum CBS 122681 TaxID=1314788 RepID=A0A6A6T0B0_9PLEO|nr:hypothetical protein K491DRAFT_605390 [Lophiostoma macrostomum CBS 122681]
MPCFKISPECPASISFYGYAPDLLANVFLFAMFLMLGFANVALGFIYKTYTYMIAMTLACIGASIGYGGRLIMHYNPFDRTGFMIQIASLIISPTFNSAALYLTLKHITLAFGSQFSRIRPALYTYIFIAGDMISIAVQGAGGGIASSVYDPDQLKLGNDPMNAGVAWQVACLLLFSGAAIDYVVRRRWAAGGYHPLDTSARALLNDFKFRLFVGSVILATVVILGRCVYRIVEMAGGFGNRIMKEEAPFIAIEGGFILAATVVQTVFHPGYCFPALSSRSSRDRSGEKSIAFEMTSVKMWALKS